MTRTFTTELLTMWRDMPTWEQLTTILLAVVCFTLVAVVCKAFYDVEHRQTRQVDREIDRDIARIAERRPSK